MVRNGSVKSVRGRLVIALSPLLLVACENTKAAAPPAPPPDVSVATVVTQTVPVTSEWIAALDGYVNAQVRPQVSGYLVQRTYREGALVRKGDVLFEIDSRPLQRCTCPGTGASHAGGGATSQERPRRRTRQPAR